MSQEPYFRKCKAVFLFDYARKVLFGCESCLNMQYEDSRPGILFFAYLDCLYMSNIRCFNGYGRLAIKNPHCRVQKLYSLLTCHCISTKKTS